MDGYLRQYLEKLENHTLGRVVYKKAYRPKGILKNLLSSPSRENLSESDVKLIEIYPTYHASEAYKDSLDEYITRHVRANMLPTGRPAVLCVLPEGRLDTDTGSSIAVFDRKDRLMGDISFQYGEIKPGCWGNIGPEGNNIFHRTYIKRPLEVDGVVFSMLSGGGAANNFGHWMFDALSRIHLLKKAGLFDKVDKFLVPAYKYDYQVESLELLDITADRVLDGSKHTHVKARELIVTTHPVETTYSIPKWVLDFTRSSFSAEKATSEPLGISPYIYICRGDASRRRILNEAEVIKCLKPYGFQALEMANYSIRDKIQIFSQAKVVVSLTSAGITNIVFGQPQTFLLEVMTKDYVTPYYFGIAHDLNMGYDFIIEDMLKDNSHNQIFQVYEDDLCLNLPKLEQKVREILGKIG